MTDWRHRAHCRTTGVGLELFFPDGETGKHNLKQIEDAKAVCAQCPVRVPCGDWALARPRPEAGIWGGLTETERRKIKRRGGRRNRAA